MTNPKIDDGVKTSVAIFLKNEIRLRWDSRDKEAEVYADHEKQAFRDLLIPLLECVVAEGVPHAITNSIDDCVRHVVRFDYPEKWSNVFAAVVEVSVNYGLDFSAIWFDPGPITLFLSFRSQHLGQRNNINAIRAGLLVLRRLVKKYEYRSPQDKELISHMVKVTFPLLLALGVLSRNHGLRFLYFSHFDCFTCTHLQLVTCARRTVSPMKSHHQW